ncbi:MAG: hypothetical protein AVDCRST_MAG75-1544 [uncultured Propionibacteriaceae bacterium]|uniref:Uncharacterized protein n=1 Tax=uncultured Propionibacteriaceae bacterium TaxID=257457 RepID=A0A6J4NMW6_9ACTN|nr:MAG: hypothetical protein AVDCRST_MAG75-1544 [uncultured Propionibacteriaceae bacterium]
MRLDKSVLPALTAQLAPQVRWAKRAKPVLPALKAQLAPQVRWAKPVPPAVMALMASQVRWAQGAKPEPLEVRGSPEPPGLPDLRVLLVPALRRSTT